MDLNSFWQYEPKQVIEELRSTADGLSTAEALKRLMADKSKKKELSPLVQDIVLFLSQFKSPLTLLLVAAVILSAFIGETSDVFIILIILLATGIMGFLQERRAGKAIEQLRSIIRTKVKVLRDNKPTDVFTEQVTFGDVLLFAAGDIIPADCLLIEGNDLHANEATLTGETFPAEKEPGQLPVDTSMSKRSNVLFEGTSIVSGSGKALAVLTGQKTVFGQISASLTHPQAETAFERGIRKFGYLLMQITIVLAVTILAVNIYFGRPLMDSLLFGLALAVGMAPELLPAIMTIAMSGEQKGWRPRRLLLRNFHPFKTLERLLFSVRIKRGPSPKGCSRFHPSWMLMARTMLT